MRGIRDLTDKEMEWALRRIPRYGVAPTAKKLRVGQQALSAAAIRRGVSSGEMQTRAKVSYVAAAAGVTNSAVATAAHKDGVVMGAGAGGSGGVSKQAYRFLTVPNEWAAEFIAERKELRENWELTKAGWMPQRDAAKRIGISDTSLANALQGKGTMAPVFKNARTVRARSPRGQHCLLIDPHTIDAALGMLREHEYLARRMTTAKALALEMGVRLTTMHVRVKSYPGSRRLIRGGRATWHVRNEDADDIRRQMSKSAQYNRWDRDQG